MSAPRRVRRGGPALPAGGPRERRVRCRPGRAVACIALTGLVLVWARQAGGERADYVGPAACGGCHQEAYAIWRESAHARAGERLGTAPEGRCLACHTTGEAPAGRPFFDAVTCEACHGPGAGYALEDVMRNPHLARMLGLRDLSTPAARAALCLGCHRAETRLRPFDPASAYQRIEHR